MEVVPFRTHLSSTPRLPLSVIAPLTRTAVYGASESKDPGVPSARRPAKKGDHNTRGGSVLYLRALARCLHFLDNSLLSNCAQRGKEVTGGDRVCRQ